MERTYEGNEYRKNPKTSLTLSTKVNQIAKEDKGGKFETITSHLA
jgi:hypothetical protein